MRNIAWMGIGTAVLVSATPAAAQIEPAYDVSGRWQVESGAEFTVTMTRNPPQFTARGLEGAGEQVFRPTTPVHWYHQTGDRSSTYSNIEAITTLDEDNRGTILFRRPDGSYFNAKRVDPPPGGR